MTVTHPDGSPRPYSPDLAVRDFVQDARDRWKFRRIMIFGAALLLGVVLLVLAFGGESSKFEATVWAFVSLVGIYIGAPVADDWLQTRPGARAA